MIIRLDGDLAGEFATRLAIDGVALGQTGTQKFIRSLLAKLPLKINVTIKGPFRALIATAKSFRDPRQQIRDVLPVPARRNPRNRHRGPAPRRKTRPRPRPPSRTT